MAAKIYPILYSVYCVTSLSVSCRRSISTVLSTSLARVVKPWPPPSSCLAQPLLLLVSTCSTDTGDSAASSSLLAVLAGAGATSVAGLSPALAGLSSGASPSAGATTVLVVASTAASPARRRVLVMRLTASSRYATALSGSRFSSTARLTSFAPVPSISELARLR